MHIFLHSLHFLYVNITISTEYKLSALHVRISEENKFNGTTQQFITTKISGCAFKTGEWNTFVIVSEQFTTEKWGCADVLSNTSSRA